MLDKFEDGLDRAFGEIFGGLIIPITISSLVSTGLIPYYSIWILYLIGIGSVINLIREMSLWATSYIVGWLIGIFILTYSGLLTLIDILIYLIPLVFLVYRVFKLFNS